ncbi:hypothetical protein OH76DRAFT_1366011 [Lentinus brumalis]|uniref:DUF4218 domain-containing protein n=1 Tax=Lentinus brumalis TaxID=2498619 RepID=A0A371CJY5_9APHY|nr:hypothetical protein OH76DRAFT_1366011 [Polyporus brumalis]
MHNLFLGELRHHCMKIFGLKGAEGRSPSRQAVHSPTEQQKSLDRIYDRLLARDTVGITDVRKDYLQTVARFNSILVPADKQTKLGYAQTFVQWVSAHILRHAAFRIPPPLPMATNQFCLLDEIPKIPPSHEIFTSSVLAKLRKDMRNTVLSSWMEKPPADIGTASHGKLKADHWRTLCTVSMVITLVPLWGTTSASKSERQALDNFMHLVAAVDLATRRSMNVGRATAFDNHMEQYVRGLRDLYDAQLVPNHHLSLHLIDCLLLFGPTHGWWAFPFERYNGLLQRIKTNSKGSEIPATLMRYFYLNAKLRWLIEAVKWPNIPFVSDLVRSFGSTFLGSRKGTVSAQIFDSLDDDDPSNQHQSRSQQALDSNLYHHLLALINKTSTTSFGSEEDGVLDGRPFLSASAEYVHSVDHRVFTYSTSGSRRRDSYVTYSVLVNGVREIRAGQIGEIFYHTRTEDGEEIVEPFFVIDRFKPLSREHAEMDPFRQFPDVPAWLCYHERDPTPHLARQQDIVSHFAALVYTPTDIGKECILIRSLDRVRLSFVAGIVFCADFVMSKS